MSQAIYKEQLKRAMSWLSDQSDTIFLGQSVLYEGTGLYDTLSHLPKEKRIEFPVAENFQMGFSIGMALNGFVPISVYPRWNFLLSATDQVVNHLDKLFFMSDGQYNPKVIIRVAVGSVIPVDPQDQHKGNFSDAFSLMCKNIDVIEAFTPEKVFEAYKYAYNNNKSSIIVESSDYGK